MRSDATEEDGRAALLRRFREVIADLAEGGLMFPPPFDLATSLALAANIDMGVLAERLFDVTAERDTQFQVAIYACSPEYPDIRRQIVDTRVASSQLLTALLETVLDELDARAQAHP